MRKDFLSLTKSLSVKGEQEENNEYLRLCVGFDLLFLAIVMYLSKEVSHRLYVAHFAENVKELITSMPMYRYEYVVQALVS